MADLQNFAIPFLIVVIAVIGVLAMESGLENSPINTMTGLGFAFGLASGSPGGGSAVTVIPLSSIKVSPTGGSRSNNKIWKVASPGWGPPYCVCTKDSLERLCKSASRYALPLGAKPLCTPAQLFSGNFSLQGQDCALYNIGTTIKTAMDLGSNFRCEHRTY